MKTDKSGNIIGDGNYHVDYSVFDMSDYPSVSCTVNESEFTESVYVRYYNADNDKSVTVRFSWHSNNAVKFGDQLDGCIATRDEVLYHLGLKSRKFVSETRLMIATRYVKKADVTLYSEADLTIHELYALGAGADLSSYTGKVAKGSNILILGKTVEEVPVTRLDSFGKEVKIGKYIYE